MSIDVFGRNLGGAKSSRGLPGIGYNLTVDNQFDISNKRLCNVAAPEQLNDAVNLNTLQSKLEIELKSMYNDIETLKNTMTRLNTKMVQYRKIIDKKILLIDADLANFKNNFRTETNKIIK